MAKGSDEQTSLIPQVPKPARFGAVETAVLKVDSSYAPSLNQVVAIPPPEKPAVELRDEVAGGRIILRDSNAEERVSIRVKSEGGSVRLTDAQNAAFAYLGSIDNSATLAVGGDGSLPGRIVVRGGHYQDRVLIWPSNVGAGIRLNDTNGKWFGYLGDSNGNAELTVGGDGTLPGRISVRAGHYQDRVLIWPSADGAAIRLHDSQGKWFAYLGDSNGNAELALGGENRLPGRIVLRNGQYQDQIVLDGSSGDIMLMNADCAEFFTVSGEVEAGTVVVLSDEDGVVRACDKEYDARVVGVVSGAGQYRPGIVLDYQGPADDRKPVALMGKVVCKVEADSAPITPGSLLTTSAIPGHARAATDRDLAFGAVLGKAMGGLSQGTGSIPVLVTLQ